MSERYIVGYDGAEPGRAALRWALDRGGDIVVVHVNDVEAGVMGSDYRLEEERRGAAIVSEALGLVRSGHPQASVVATLLEGRVAWSLAEFAQPGDILVIGTHKTGFLHGRVLGSRSVEVAMLARSDVAVIPAVDLRFRSGVVAGVEDEPGLDAVVLAAAAEAKRRREELLLLHSVRSGGAERGKALLDRALRKAQEVAPGIVIRTRASNRAPSELLLDAARDRALLVIGTGGADRARSPIGSVLHDVLLNITAPALVAHSRDRAGTDSPLLEDAATTG